MPLGKLSNVPELPPNKINNSRPSEEQNLLNDQEQKIEGELKFHLPTGEPIDIGMEQQPEYVDYKEEGADYEVEKKMLDENILEVFQKKEFQKKLLILGSPGSGKTVTLLRLAKYLIKSAINDSNQRIPCIYNLFYWKNEPIDEWLRKNLSSEEQDKEVKLNRILPMLDGLDLLEPDLQKECIKKINEVLTHKKVNYLVVCSRKDAYADASSNELIKLKAAVCLQPLTDKQIQELLTGIGHNDIWKAIEQNDNLKKLFRVPLLLCKIIKRYEYQDKKKKNFAALSPEVKLRLCIFSYIEHKIDEVKQEKYEKRKILTYILSMFLISSVNSQDSKRKLFYIDALQPSCLSPKMLGLYRILTGVISFIYCVIILVTVLLGQVLWQENQVYIFILLVSLPIVLFGIIRSLQIKPVWTLKWSLNKAIKCIFPILKFTPIIGVVIAIFCKQSPLFVVKFSIVMAIFALQISGLKTIETGGNRGSKQGIWQSIKNSIGGFIIGLFEGLILCIISILIRGQASWIIIPILGMLLWLITGGITCIQHFCLRLTLYKSGCIPWNYSKFLRHATKLKLLKEDNGGYQFIYAEFQDQFVETLKLVQEQGKRI